MLWLGGCAGGKVGLAKRLLQHAMCDLQLKENYEGLCIRMLHASCAESLNTCVISPGCLTAPSEILDYREQPDIKNQMINK